MAKYYFQACKRFWKNQKFLIIPVLFILLLIYMASGYGLLKSSMQLNLETEIIEKNQDKIADTSCKAVLTFKETNNLKNNIFTYDIIITNNSSVTCQGWQLKIINPDYIIFSDSFSGIKEANYLLLNNSSWNAIIKPQESVKTSITFEVTNNLKKFATLRETANFFVNHYIFFVEKNNENKTIINGKAKLLLLQYEEELKNYTLIENLNYNSNDKKEHQYILTIMNNSNKNYLSFRANLYFGDSNTLLAISNTTTLNMGVGNITFKSLNNLKIYPNSRETIYITIYEEEPINPDIVLAMVLNHEKY